MQGIYHGQDQNRTKPMERAQALRFARALEANPRFTNVSVAESRQAKAPAKRWVVWYQSSNPARRAAVRDREQTARQQRAEAEGSRYLWVLDTDHPFFHCLSTSGEVWEVTHASCSCPDATYRCKPAGLLCKHSLALISGVGQQVDMETFSEQVAA